jgi:peptidoglycan/xylan/chitin deacetylase (PgdA/CDA1 family)
MRNLLFIIIFIPGLLSCGQKKHVCFSIDDLPVVSYGISDTTYLKNLTEKLVLSLKNNKIQAIGFVNGTKLLTNKSVDKFQVELLRIWLSNGMDLGNHTFSHPDYNNVSLKEFSYDIIKGENVLKELIESSDKTLKYFRHPFLHTGNSKEKSDSLNNFLSTHGYVTAPVTIDNDDYLFAVAYKRAKSKTDIQLAARIGHEYINYMEAKVKYYEKQVNILFGTDINQILLIHASLLNADYSDSLAQMFRRNNYDFTSMEQALKDEVYKSDITVFGNYGISWIDRWALTQGKKGAFFKDEPVTPDYIKKLAE